MSEATHSAVCVIGMHRSGTSMVAGVLQAAGLHLGAEADVLGAEPSNPEGHFENLRFLGVNEALLASLGGTWSEPPVRFAGWETSEHLAAHREVAAQAVASVGSSSPWGWKDPRTTLLLPFWRALLPDLRFVVCLRSPLEVALSLQRRDALPLRRGSELWVEYTREAVLGTAGAARFFLFYEDFLAHPGETLAELAEFCGLDPDCARAEAMSRIHGSLRHHVGAPEQAIVEPEISFRANLLHLGLRALLDTGSGPIAGGVVGAEREAALEQMARVVGELRDPAESVAAQRSIEEQAKRIRELVWGIEAAEAETERARRDHEASEARFSALAREHREYVDSVESSLTVRFARSLGRAKDVLFPAGSARRRAYDRWLARVKSGPPAAPAAQHPPIPSENASVPREPAPFDEPERRAPSGTSAPAAPLASLIVRTCEGRRGCLEEAVGSILQQDHPNLEVVVVEDGGCAARDWLATLRLPPHVRLTYQPLPKVGRCVAGNRGLAIASGKYAGFLDDDDRLLPDHVSTLVAELERRPELAGAYAVAERAFTRVHSYTPFRYEEVKRDIPLREPFDRQDLWVRNLFPIQAVLFRRELFDEFGGFHPELALLEDWDLWLRYASRRNFGLVDRVTSLYRVPADPEEEARRAAEIDASFPPFRREQARIDVRVSLEEMRSLVGKVLDERKYYRLAQKLGLADVRRVTSRSRALREFFADRADADGTVATTTAEALQVAHRVLDEDLRLRWIVRLSREVRRRPALKRLADRGYLAVERHL
ncbi:MAG: glycosyltransferase [Candidatus Eiseniibacteriota bacterium]